jgi:MFS superfamily sulfate permease-like transporter
MRSWASNKSLTSNLAKGHQTNGDHKYQYKTTEIANTAYVVRFQGLIFFAKKQRHFRAVFLHM